MSDYLYIKFDVKSNSALSGLFQLPADLSKLDPKELAELSIYTVLLSEYDIGEKFDQNFFSVSSASYMYQDSPFPSVIQLIETTQKDLNDVKHFVVNKFNDYRNYLLDSGFVYGSYLFDANESARLNWTAAVSSITAAGYMNGLSYKDVDLLPLSEWTRKDNHTAVFKPSEILECGLRLGKWSSECFRYCRLKKTQVLESKTFEEVFDIWNTNTPTAWPSSDLGGKLSLPQP